MMTVEKLKVVDETVNEEVVTKTDEELAEMATELIHLGYKEFKKYKMKMVGKGFVVGLVTAVAIQSLVTIFILLNS